jgi:hypothetical protein
LEAKSLIGETTKQARFGILSDTKNVNKGFEMSLSLINAIVWVLLNDLHDGSGTKWLQSR